MNEAKHKMLVVVATEKFTHRNGQQWMKSANFSSTPFTHQSYTIHTYIACTYMFVRILAFCGVLSAFILFPDFILAVDNIVSPHAVNVVV